MTKFETMNVRNHIQYVIGDATAPQGDGLKIIAHICNDIGAWGAGFVLALSAKWEWPEMYYRSMVALHLGKVQFVPVGEDVIVANMVAQHGIKPDELGEPPIRYDALFRALKRVNMICLERGATLHLPRIGAGLAGGDWNKIAAIIERVIEVPITVYDLS